VKLCCTFFGGLLVFDVHLLDAVGQVQGQIRA